jgi:histidyl-tRNA synthetase
MAAIPPVKGTRDFYPEAMAFRIWLYDRLRQVSQSFGYQEYEPPFLERLELYAAKSGDELAREQAYVFPDRGGDLIALRPELTPSLARMVAARSAELPRPIRWWSFGPVWRYERPQKGRSREFFQWNLDLMGVESPAADAETAAVAVELLRAVGLGPDKVQLLVNNRALAETKYLELGLAPDQLPAAFRLVDRRDKLPAAEWLTFGQELGLSQASLDGMIRLLADEQGWRESPALSGFFETAQALGVAEYMRFDASVVRGLDYYTGTVFEARDRDGRFRAILGGGRYDDLVADVGGDRIPGVGFAMGDVTIGLMIQELGTAPAAPPPPAQVLVCWVDEPTRLESVRLAGRLRQTGLQVEWYPAAERLPRQLKYADRQKIPLAIIVGSRELEEGSLTIKDLRDGRQIAVPRDSIVDQLMTLLEAPRQPC